MNITQYISLCKILNGEKEKVLVNHPILSHVQSVGDNNEVSMEGNLSYHLITKILDEISFNDNGEENAKNLIVNFIDSHINDYSTEVSKSIVLSDYKELKISLDNFKEIKETKDLFNTKPNIKSSFERIEKFISQKIQELGIDTTKEEEEKKRKEAAAAAAESERKRKEEEEEEKRRRKDEKRKRKEQEEKEREEQNRKRKEQEEKERERERKKVSPISSLEECEKEKQDYINFVNKWQTQCNASIVALDSILKEVSNGLELSELIELLQENYENLKKANLELEEDSATKLRKHIESSFVVASIKPLKSQYGFSKESIDFFSDNVISSGSYNNFY